MGYNEERLLEESRIISESILNWEKQMDKWNQKVDLLPVNHTSEDLIGIEKELAVLIARGEMEIRNMEKWLKNKKEYAKE